MGYNHMLGRPRELDLPRFQAVVRDFTRLLAPLEDHDAYIATGYPDAPPRIDDAEICFNGTVFCRHGKTIRTVRDVDGILETRQPPPEDPKFMGQIRDFDERSCRGGNCRHNDFHLERIFWYPGITAPEDPRGLYWSRCKTNRKPYDLAVTCCLIVVRHHFGKDVAVDSHGDEPEWLEARLLCEQVLGYGLDTLLWHASASSEQAPDPSLPDTVWT